MVAVVIAAEEKDEEEDGSERLPNFRVSEVGDWVVCLSSTCLSLSLSLKSPIVEAPELAFSLLQKCWLVGPPNAWRRSVKLSVTLFRHLDRYPPLLTITLIRQITIRTCHGSSPNRTKGR